MPVSVQSRVEQHIEWGGVDKEARDLEPLSKILHQ